MKQSSIDMNNWASELKLSLTRIPDKLWRLLKLSVTRARQYFPRRVRRQPSPKQDHRPMIGG